MAASASGVCRTWGAVAVLALAAAWPPPLHAATPAAAPSPAAPALMLANVYRPGLGVAGYWVSEKYDGVRAHWSGQALVTRSGRPIAAPAWFTAGWPAVPMDGELWAGRGRFEQASSAAASEVPDDDAWRSLRYMVFDLPAHPGPFDERHVALAALVARLRQPWVFAVEQVRVPDAAALQRRLLTTVAAGGEGLMLHRGAALHRVGRSDDLLKLKLHEDAEAVVVGHLPGQGKYRGQTGALLVSLPDGRRLRLGSGLKDADRREPPALGSTVTYRFRGHHASGLPRFAVFVRVRRE